MLSRILSNRPRWLAAATLALGLAACGGGGGMSGGSGPGPQGCSSSTCGNALLTLTDAAGDFASYTVDVASLQLTKADGTVVETLPVKTRVDFTQLVDVTEFVAAAAIPQGEYVSATMTLDYSNAAIFVYTDANDSQSVQVAQVLDSTGKTLWSSTPPAPASSTVTVTVQLDNKNHLFITPGKLARLALDFNVAASNNVDLTNPAAPQVQVKAFIVASVVPADTKSIRVRGTLVSVDVAGGTYTVDVEPFNDADSKRGQVVIHTTAQTTFAIDGTSYTQTDGLNALNAEPAGTITVAFGTLSKADQTFTATQVLAGSSVQSTKLDRLQGVVISRSAADANGVITLVVRRGTIETHADGDCKFSAKDVALQFGAGTKITSAVGEPTAPVTAWPSVGSEITAFGTATTSTSAAGDRIFDATAGQLRLELTTLWGSTNSIGSAEVTLNLQAIEGLPVNVFDFTGTGSNPASYVVNTGVLPLAAAPTALTPVRFIGLVQPFGLTPPDFNALTLANFTGTSALLEAGYGSGSTAALTASATSLVLNVSDPMFGPMHFIRIGPALIDLTKLTSNVTIVPDAASMGPFAIRTEAPPGMGEPDMIEVFNNYADFETLLATKLAGGAKVLKVIVLGHYDQSSNTFTAVQIALDLS
jgi:hypothetical protein